MKNDDDKEIWFNPRGWWDRGSQREAGIKDCLNKSGINHTWGQDEIRNGRLNRKIIFDNAEDADFAKLHCPELL